MTDSFLCHAFLHLTTRWCVSNLGAWTAEQNYQSVISTRIYSGRFLYVLFQACLKDKKRKSILVKKHFFSQYYTVYNLYTIFSEYKKRINAVKLLHLLYQKLVSHLLPASCTAPESWCPSLKYKYRCTHTHAMRSECLQTLFLYAPNLLK